MLLMKSNWFPLNYYCNSGSFFFFPFFPTQPLKFFILSKKFRRQSTLISASSSYIVEWTKCILSYHFFSLLTINFCSLLLKQQTSEVAVKLSELFPSKAGKPVIILLPPAISNMNLSRWWRGMTLVKKQEQFKDYKASSLFSCIIEPVELFWMNCFSN